MNSKFTDKMFYKFLAPSFICAIGLALANIVDSLVVGRSLGESGLAAIGITLPIYMIYSVFYIGIGAGGSVEYSKLLGEGKSKEAVKVFNMMLYASIFISLLFVAAGSFLLDPVMLLLGASKDNPEVYGFARDYAGVLLSAAPVFFINWLLYCFVRSDNNQKLASLSFVTGNILDVLMNIIFVIVLDFGVTGAVWATVVGQCVSFLIYLPHLLSKKTILKLKLSKPSGKKIYSVFKIGFSTSNQYIFQFIFVLLMNNILMRISGETSVAVFDILMNASYVGLCFYQASAETLLPLASTFHSEKNSEAQRRTLRLSLNWGIASSAITLSLIVVFARQVCRLFGLENESAIAMGSKALFLYCIGALFAGVSIIFSGYYQSIGREKRTFFITLLRSALILYPCTVLLGTLNDIEIFWLLFPITEILSLIIWGVLALFTAKKTSDKDFDMKRVFSCFIDDKKESITNITSQIEEFCEAWEANMKQTYYVNMAVEELCLAIMSNAFDNEGDNYIQLTLIAHYNGEFELHIRDNASSFNPFDMTTKKVGIEDESEDLGSIGILLVKNKAKDFFYRRYQGFNTLTVRV